MAILSSIFYFVGVVTIGVTIGNLFAAPHGFLVIGGGLILFPVFHALICMLYRKAGMEELL